MELFGIWLGAFFTLFIFSFLYKDNPFYKIAEQIYVGISAGYWFIYTIYNVLIPNLFSQLQTDFSGNIVLLIPAFLGILMLCRLIPHIEWVSRYPIALMIGTTAGIQFVRYLQSDVINQITATILNPFASSNITVIIGQLILIIGTVTGVIYFYFSKKHEGVLGGTARLGIIFLMISFGAAFGYTL
ncbi:MAG: hypothetical protein ACP5EQ_04515, partial [Candidatus Cloacimonadia bacterium]